MLGDTDVIDAGTQLPGVRQRLTPAEVDAQIMELFAAVPDEADADEVDMAARILQATSIEELQQGGSLPNAEDMEGRTLLVQRVTKRPSTVGNGLPWYLLVDSVNTETGEYVRWQTSATTVALTLCKLVALGGLPETIRISRSEKPTKRGFYPLNIAIVDVTGRKGR
jgi:hypothetical protein